MTISGFAAVNALGGALDNQREDPGLSTSLDLANDTEVHVLLRGRHGSTGLEYGGTVELEADTNVAENANETWMFMRGGWGELRVGDVEGPVDASALGAATIAAGTGGIDGEVIDVLTVDAVLPTNSAEATKVRYYSPSFGGLQLGLSYAPHDDISGDSLATTESGIVDWVEAALVYEGEGSTFDLAGSVVGSIGQVKDRGRQDLWTWYAGGSVTWSDLELGAGLGNEDVGGLEKQYVNAGVGYLLDPVYASVTVGRVLRTRGYDGVGEPWNLVVSADLELMPGLLLAGDVAYLDNDLDVETREPTGGDDGVVWVTRLELAF